MSSPKSASYDVNTCSEVLEFDGEGESDSIKPQNVCVSSVHGKQCVQLTTQSFSNVSKRVEHTNKPRMPSGSWQGL